MVRRHAAMVGFILAAAACSSSPPEATLKLDGPFVGIPREDNLAQAQGLANQLGPTQSAALPGSTGIATGESFYLAIKRSELSTRWFLSAYIRQYSPDPVGTGIGSLGTRVVSFAIQNGKLFVFDASDLHHVSNIFDPDVLIDAYPIIASNARFNALPHASDYVLIDPSAGLNRFEVIGDWLGSGSAPVRFTVDLNFTQHLRRLDDGVTFEQLFTGHADQALAKGDTTSTTTSDNLYQASGTLGMSLRRYTEGEGFVPAPHPATNYYFLSPARSITNAGTTVLNPVKWNIHRGMKPITWLLDRAFLDLAQDPRLAGVDVVAAVKRGVENWNSVFGYPVFEARVADPSDSYADDDKNFIVFDKDPTLGYAYADWRINPNTGEIRGASVYFNEGWVESILDSFPSSSAAQRSAAQATINARPRLQWSGMRPEPLCQLVPPLARPTRPASVDHREPSVSGGEATWASNVEAYFTNVILHEVGHNLGLRHNFKGSFSVPSTSVMDYLDPQYAIRRTTPGPYDVDALAYLYGTSATQPAEPFCTDPDTKTDVNCNHFDIGSAPLTATYAPEWDEFQMWLLDWGWVPSDMQPYVEYYLDPMLQFVRAGTPAERHQAYLALFRRIHAPLPDDNRPVFVLNADLLARTIFQRLYLDPPERRGNFRQDPPVDDWQFNFDILPELQNNLLDVDHVRSFETRRVTVDVLKRMQSASAQQVLVAARKSITAERAQMNDATIEAIQTDDLLARIDRAITPYY